MDRRFEAISLRAAGRALWPHVGVLAAVSAWLLTFFCTRAYAIGHGSFLLPWDASWYSSIARDGYHFSSDPTQQDPVAFLPLFPLVLRAAMWTGLALPTVVALTCGTLAVAGTALLYRSLLACCEPRLAASAIVLLLGNPFSIYFLDGYSESLYLFLLGGFSYALAVRKSALLAAVSAGLATAVRPYAVVLWLVYVAAELFRHPRAHTRSACFRIIALGPLFACGIFATELYFYAQYGDLSLYRNVLAAWGGDPISSGVTEFIDHLAGQARMLWSTPASLVWSYPPTLARVQLLGFMALVAWLWRSVPRLPLIYGLVLVAFVLLLTEGTVNLGRHMATNVAMPLLIAIAIRRIARRLMSSQPAKAHVLDTSTITIVFIAGLLMQILYIRRFYFGQWVS